MEDLGVHEYGIQVGIRAYYDKKGCSQKGFVIFENPSLGLRTLALRFGVGRRGAIGASAESDLGQTYLRV